MRLLTTVFNVAGAFFAFVVGGWVAARVAGLRRAEPAMLHGVIAWLVTLPLMLALAAFGATAMYGGWYAGIVAGPAWVAVPPMTPELAAAVRNGAMAAVVALLLGSDRRRARRLDGLGRADAHDLLPPARPGRVRRAPPRGVTQRRTLQCSTSWPGCSGVPLGVIVLLFLFGIGR